MPSSTGLICPDRRGLIAGFGALLCVPFTARAELSSGPQSVVSGAQKIGTGRFTYLGMTPFSVTLYAPQGTYDPDGTFAVQLVFLRKIKASRIVSVSVNEIKRQGFTDATKLSEWREQLVAIMPTMEKNGDITGVRNGQGHAIFYLNGQQIGAIRDDEFSRYFFGIWLSDKSRSPSLRKQLLGV
ncbi:MAG: chalcone isomerase family protein [Asticcacaulis sp.]